jgi:hypothetical protein
MKKIPDSDAYTCGLRFGRITGDWTMLVTASAAGSPAGQGPGCTGGRACRLGRTKRRTGTPVSGDDAIVLAKSLRQPEQFSHIYDRPCPAVSAYIASRMGLDADDDLAAETFIDAFRKRGSLDATRGSVRPLLLGIATRLARSTAGRGTPLPGPRPYPGGPGPWRYEDRVAARFSPQPHREPLLQAAVADLLRP